ncbi:MAG TPA: c-type cytochrome domain-containing protein [Pirellulales bacterium]
MRRLAVFTVIAASLASINCFPLFAEPTADQQRQVAELEKSLKSLPALLRGKKVDEAAELVEQAKQTLSALKSSAAKDDLAPAVASLQKKLAAAERMLEKAEATKPAKPRKPPRKRPGKNDKKPADEPAKPDAVSFTKDIAPILSAKCAGCHIRQSKGGFSLATFAGLKKGSESGTVFSPGKGEGSRLVEVLANGDMPRGGGPLPPEQIALISRWIDQGAKFDGKSETDPLTPGPTAAGTPAAAVQFSRATGSESVQFVRDLAPTIVSTCIDCHGGMQPAGRLNLTTFAGLLRGGDSGPIVAPGKPEDSLLIKKLKGTAGQRMPLRKPPLEDALIQKFFTWIAEGAKFDWADTNETLDWAVRVTVASKMSHDELAAMRAGLAEKNWRLGNPETKPETIVDEHFILVGNLSPTRMNELAELAREAQAKVAKALQVPADEPFMKGKLTLFAFRRHFDYTEFGTMVERRELPTDWRGHWRYTVVDCYGCVMAPDDDKGIAATLAEDFAGAYIESQGKTPRWFAEGAARAIAARLSPKDALVKQWDEQVKEAVAAGRTADEFLKAGDVVSGDGAALSYGFLKPLAGRTPKLLALLRDVHRGADFNSAFEKHMGSDPAALAAAWVEREAYRRN